MKEITAVNLNKANSFIKNHSDYFELMEITSITPLPSNKGYDVSLWPISDISDADQLKVKNLYDIALSIALES